jgi:hypothetical protein
MKAYGGSRGISLPILNLSTKWRQVLNPTPRLLYPKERTPITIEYEKCGPQSRSGRFGEDKQLLPLLEFVPRIFRPVA